MSAFINVGKVKDLSRYPNSIAILTLLFFFWLSPAWADRGQQGSAVPPAAPEKANFSTEDKLREMAPETSPLLDGRRLSKIELINVFLEVAFSNVIWLENTPEPTYFYKALRLIEIISSEEDYFKPLPRHIKDSWIGKYIFTGGQFPASGVINKWTSDEISIGIGWPKHIGDIVETDMSDDTVNRFSEIASALARNISHKTGLKIVFKPVDLKSEAGENFARIRILPISGTGLVNKYKSYIANTIDYMHPNLGVLGLLVGGVEFSPFSKVQVDGFLLPNQDNSIGLSVCRIVSAHDTDVLTALMTECVLRALGLPAVLKKAKVSSFLSEWNSSEEAVSKTLLLDGESALYLTEKATRFELPDGEIAAFYPTDKSALFDRQADLPEYISNVVKDAQITDTDAYLLSLLYCDAIKPGMSKLEAAVTLFQHDGCPAH